MNRRGALTVLAFLAAGVLIAEFAVNYLHSSPAASVAASSSESNNGSPVVDIKVNTVAAVGFGDHPNWVGYLPTTFFKVPPNATIRMTVDQQDTPTGLRNPYLGLVRGTVGESMTVNGKTMNAIDPTLAAHTFSVPDLGVSVPLPGIDATNPKNTDNIVVFSFKVPASGIFHWQCFVPCGAGTLYGNGGPMQTLGYMDGQIEVG
ncbi:MAG: hypothetical protein JF887_00620 [Candidatus Dormibacteraeota bacterium]|uniref:Uncharacterized protein n=1 Tax=Candidatus Amunia macphersoniae TaxID=3127014 RepID=A0A934KJM7_9BACT|nr:hypothetical protein [Candidatus Dormibacteraeota bacterium]